MATVTHTKMSGPEAAYGLGQTHILPVSRRVPHVVSLSSSSHEGLQTQLASQHQQQTPEQRYQQQHQHRENSAQKMICAKSTHDNPATRQMHTPSFSNGVYGEHIAMTLHSQNMPLCPQAHTYGSDMSPTHSEHGHPGPLAQAHHHHHLPNHPPPLTSYRTGYSHDVYTAGEYGSQSVMGQPGMPDPAAKPSGPKRKFTPQEDALLVKLKETKDLT
jgi:hypothetical protein